MSLRLQLLAVSLLTLVLPWAGCQYVREMEGALRQGQENALLSNARTVAAALENQVDLLYPTPEQMQPSPAATRDIYAHDLTAAVSLDGYFSDWGLDAKALSHADSESISIDYAAGIHSRFLYLYVAVKKHSPGRSGDDVVRICATNIAGTGSCFDFSTIAPGRIFPRRSDLTDAGKGDVEQRIAGEWQEQASGYLLEIRIPLNLAGTRLGLEVLDRGLENDSRISTFEDNIPGLLIRKPDGLANELKKFEQPDQRIRVTDFRGWLLGDAGRLGSSPDDRDRLPLIDRFYLRLLGTQSRYAAVTSDEPGRVGGIHIETALAGDAESGRFESSAGNLAIIAAAYPIKLGDEVIGAVIAEQTSEVLLSRTSKSISRLMNITLLAASLAALGMLAFATVLSIRIRRIRDAADQAVSPEGRIIAGFPGTGAADELGDLSRSFSVLMQRLKTYNRYLEALAGRLSHELRTPLAIVESSLENLEHSDHSDEAKTYARRARQGTSRLKAILKVMSEAARVEQALESSQAETFDIKEWFDALAAAYRDTHRNRNIEIVSPDKAGELTGQPELLAQMLDKLVDNAVDFSKPGARIELALDADTDCYRIRVSNQGDNIPDEIREQLFESMISHRSVRDDKPHLGFGLYIARLIVMHHKGDISASNAHDPAGVVFEVRLPK